jgi:hypothetical protein
MQITHACFTEIVNGNGMTLELAQLSTSTLLPMAQSLRREVIGIALRRRAASLWNGMHRGQGIPNQVPPQPEYAMAKIALISVQCLCSISLVRD